MACDDSGGGSHSSDIPPVDSNPYTLTVVNGSGGMLADVYIGSYYCGDLDEGESCYYEFASKPSSVTISKSSASNMGDLYTDDVNVYPGSSSSEQLNLTLSSSYYALWVHNYSSYSLDYIGFNYNLDTDTYYAAWYLSPYITNNGYDWFMGFFPTTYSFVDLWSGDSYWPYEITSFSTNSYDSQWACLNAYD